LAFTLTWAVGFYSAVACGCRAVFLFNNLFLSNNVGDNNVGFEVFPIEDFEVRVIRAEVLVYELDWFLFLS